MFALPSFQLAHMPTPLEAAPRLARELGLGSLWIKREDLSGYALGGNKLRQIDLILAEAREHGADTLVTTAGVQSNFCRALAAGAAKAGFGCVLLLRGDPGAPVQGNHLLDRLLGAEVRFVPALDPWGDDIISRLDEVADELRARGRRPTIVHLPGRTAGLAAAAWVMAAGELDRQWQDAGIDPSAVIVAAGSGLTAAGLALGLKHVGRRARVHAVSVQQPAERLRGWIPKAANAAAERLHIATRLFPDDLDVRDEDIGPGYGVPTPASLAAITRAARSEALLLDPVYTGKAMAALASLCAGGSLDATGSVVFLHSGGTPGLFAAADVVARHLENDA